MLGNVQVRFLQSAQAVLSAHADPSWHIENRRCSQVSQFRSGAGVMTMVTSE
jgi:hypothetical protein